MSSQRHLTKNSDVKVLISCKEYRQSKAEPADVQEWAAVVRTMNQYATATRYLGLIISPSGSPAVVNHGRRRTTSE